MKQFFKLNIDGLVDQFPFEMKIIDREGKIQYKEIISKKTINFKVDLKPDLYLLKFYGKDIVHTQKIIIQ